MADGQHIVTVALAVFAFTTVLGWPYYGERCRQYLFKERSLVVYRALWMLAALAFARHEPKRCAGRRTHRAGASPSCININTRADPLFSK